MSIKIEDIWEKILEWDTGDPPIRRKAMDPNVVNRLKAQLSSYKHRALTNDKQLREVLGEFKLVYALEPSADAIDPGTILSITLSYERSEDKELPVEWL